MTKRETEDCGAGSTGKARNETVRLIELVTQCPVHLRVPILLAAGITLEEFEAATQLIALGFSEDGEPDKEVA